MEETVWDEIIDPSSLSDDPGRRLPPPRPTAVIFQDFLGPPINTFPPPPLPVSSSNSGASSLTALSLTAAFDASPFEASPGGFPCFGSTQPGPRDSEETASGGGDRRHKRMIKNRESAARSRARKQAYTNELELEVAHLVQENAMLRKQQEQYQMALATPHPEKRRLHRSSTAPF